MSCNHLFSTASRKDYSKRTHIKRDPIEREFKNKLAGRDSIILVSGASKSGKSRLVYSVLENVKDNIIEIGAGTLSRAEDVWDIIAYALGLTEIYSEKAILGKLEIQKTFRSKDFYVVIEDFHYIPKSIYQDILKILKSLKEQGANIIIIGVASPFLEEVYSFPDLEGRIEKVVVEPWKVEELVEIARRGLNANLQSYLGLDPLAYEALHSPYLMTKLCRAYCEKHLPKDFASEGGVFIKEVTETDVNEIAPKIAEDINMLALYKQLTSEQACLINEPLKRHDGRIGNFNQMFWYGLAAVMRTRMPQHLVDLDFFSHTLQLDVLDRGQINVRDIIYESVKHMVGYYYSLYQELNQLSPHDPIMELNGKKFHLTSSVFLFYVRHSSSVEACFY